MLIAAGTAKAQIHYSENNQEIYSSAWYTDIFPTVGGVLEESSDEYKTISKFVNRAIDSAMLASDSAEQAAGSASSAEYYYTQTKSISESLSGALKPMGTVEFSKLPLLEQVSEGDMYNISDQFTTTSEFKEGEGRVVPAGSNIYKTFDGYWDVLAGSPVTGVKGSSETAYRTGNVDITPANIGLGNVDNTSDADKPISTAAQAAFNELNSNLNSRVTLTTDNTSDLPTNLRLSNYQGATIIDTRNSVDIAELLAYTLPKSFRPLSATRFGCLIVEDNGAWYMGIITIAFAGTFTISKVKAYGGGTEVVTTGSVFFNASYP